MFIPFFYSSCVTVGTTLLMGIPTLDHLPGYSVLTQGKKYGPEPSCTKKDLESASQAIRSSVVRQRLSPPTIYCCRKWLFCTEPSVADGNFNYLLNQDLALFNFATLSED